MKKAIWIIALLALVGTAALLPFLPETVPVHFNAAMDPDRWGSRLELLVLPGVLLLLAGAMTAVLNRLERKAAEAAEEKVRASALVNRKAIGIATVSTLACLTLVQAWLLYRGQRAVVTGGGADRLPFILIGVLLIVLGNITPKTRRNGLMGFRISWSRYNDNTWRRANRFGGYALVVTGVLTALAAALVSPPAAVTAVFLALVAAAIVVTLVYTRRVYVEERERSEGHEE